jgi:hypothetical protein
VYIRPKVVGTLPLMLRGAETDEDEEQEGEDARARMSAGF